MVVWVLVVRVCVGLESGDLITVWPNPPSASFRRARSASFLVGREHDSSSSLIQSAPLEICLKHFIIYADLTRGLQDCIEIKAVNKSRLEFRN